VERLCDDFFSSAVLAGNKDARVGRANAADKLEDRLHDGGFGDERGARFGAKETIFGFEAGSLAQRVA